MRNPGGSVHMRLKLPDPKPSYKRSRSEVDSVESPLHSHRQARQKLSPPLPSNDSTPNYRYASLPRLDPYRLESQSYDSSFPRYPGAMNPSNPYQNPSYRSRRSSSNTDSEEEQQHAARQGSTSWGYGHAYNATSMTPSSQASPSHLQRTSYPMA